MTKLFQNFYFSQNLFKYVNSLFKIVVELDRNNIEFN